MKKIVLLSFLVFPFVLGGCNNNKIEGPKTNYYKTFNFRRSADNNDLWRIRDPNENAKYNVSRIEEVEEKYSYSVDRESYETIKTNTDLMDNGGSSVNPYPYCAEINLSYSYKECMNKKEYKNEYTSQKYEWDNDHNVILSIENIKGDGYEKTNYDAYYQDPKEIFEHLFIEVGDGQAYIDRDDHINIYRDSVTTTVQTDVNIGTYKTTHKEQCLYRFDDRFHTLDKYYYYDEVISNIDPITGTLLDNERVVSYHYHEINYKYEDKGMLNTVKLNKQIEGKKFVIGVNVYESKHSYFCDDNGEYDIERFGYTKEIALKPSVDFSTSNYIYTYHNDCYDHTISGIGDGFAFSYEAELNVLTAPNVMVSIMYRCTFENYKEELTKYGFDCIEDKYLINKGSFPQLPHVFLKFIVNPNNDYSMDFDVDVSFYSEINVL